ncbi:MAG TPA: hypothetical protein VN642_10575 [Dongiaceae bacterium]|nr:hypothetical protein [Dongiaceae bacterium]
MKRWGNFLALTLVTLIPSLAGAADLGMSSTTLFRFEQRAFPGFAKVTAAPATEFLRADLEKIGDGNLSLHLYGWERLDLADRSTSEKSNDGDLTYGYLDYRFPTANAQIKAGRFFINEGVAAEQVDGVSARADLRKGFTLAMFGGAPVKLDRDSKSKGDYIAGGRGSYRLKGILELGVSGLYEGGVTLNTATNTKDTRQLVGGDIWLSPHRFIDLNGHTFYNASTDGIAEHSYLLAVKPSRIFSISGIYNEQRFNNYFTYSNVRSLFNPDNGGEVKSYGGTVGWTIAAPAELTADYRHYNRTSQVITDNNGTSNRYGVDARLTFLDRKLRSGFAYHRSDGATGFNAYNEVRGYCLYDTGRYVTSVDAIAQFYKNSIFNRKEAFELVASNGYRILQNLLLSGEISYSRNPQFNDDVRGVLKLAYNYAYSSKGAKK